MSALVLGRIPIGPIQISRSSGSICLPLPFGKLPKTTVRNDHLKSGKTRSCGCGRVNPEPWKVSAGKVYRGYNDGDLTFGQFLELAKLDCHYCGAPPANQQGATGRGPTRRHNHVAEERKPLYDYVYQGLDRVDSSRPHDLDNLVPCCISCNSAKMDMGYQEFLAHIRTIYRFTRPRGLLDLFGEI